ncbi:S-layer homology domain-containing protein [Paenibacillus nasutitermitis]|uniref:SLH domain-containing protein n=1 Tax=Paenibacillus nasutitermitis TaxID=1652958 RepID=A0A916ZD30_9BACL|nr:S-layer homology domain-containing protein [Paenibacillus nasutitermitis]GGD88803.1 hypothetical protein GCM10010911_54230 [Paenibacillus nasutitermitis]
MKKRTHQGIIVFLVMMIGFGAIPGGIFGSGKAFAANEFSGNGTSGSPYLIGTAQELNLVRGQYLNANLYFKLKRNIDLSIYAASGWVPIGTWDQPFNGHIDGNGYKITGLKIADSAQDYAGLFGYMESGSSIENMKLENVNIQGGRFVGSLAALNNGGTITNSYASGTVSGTYGIGGLIGSNIGTISGSQAESHVSGSESIGGLAGINRGVIVGSFAAGDTVGTLNTGGLVGWNNYDGSIQNSHAAGSTTGSESTGGLVGWNYNGEIVSGSYATGDVIGSNAGKDVGGLAGYNQYGTISNSHASGNVSGTVEVGGLVGNNSMGQISNSYSLGNATGSSTDIGGLVGHNYIGSIRYSYSTGKVSTGTVSKDYAGGLVGYNLGGTVSNSFATGEVSGYSAGGLIGSNDSGETISSYATGKVSGTENVGGLVGWNGLGPDTIISNSYASGEVGGVENVGGLVGWNVNGPISNSYASGKVTGTIEVGGLIGFKTLEAVVNSFYDNITTGQSVSQGGTGKPTSDMQTAGTYAADAAHSWDFSNIWDMDSRRNGGYPFLREIQVYLDYDGNGNTGGTVPDSVSYMPGTRIGINTASSQLTRTGYILDGWNTEADGSGSLYKSGDVYTLTSTAALFAHWVIPSAIASLTSTIGTVSTGGTASETITDIPFGTTLAALKAAIAPAAGATFEVYDADGTTIAAALTTGKKIIVTTYDGLTKAAYTVYVDAGSSDATLTSSIGTVSQGGTADETISAIPYGTTIAALERAITPAAGAAFDIFDADGVTVATVLATGKKVIVTSENGTVATYTVSVITNTEATLTSAIGTVSAGGTANETITVPYGTTLAALKAAITPAGGAAFEVYNADGTTVATALATGGKIIVTAENGTNRVTYAITVSKNTDATLTSTLGNVSTGGTANEFIRDIPFGTTLAALKAAITTAAGATFEIYNNNGTTVATSLQSGRKAIVTAQDGVTKVTYFLVIELNSDARMTSTVGTVSTGGTPNETITVPYGTTYDTLSYAIKPAVGAQAAFYEADGTTVTTTLTTGTKIVITSQNALNQVTYTVTIAANNAKDITAFSFAEQSGTATINKTNRTVAIKVVNGTNPTGLVATFALSAGATAKVSGTNQVSGTTANDFTNPVIYAVTAADGSTQNWTVTVTVVASSAKAITSFSFAEQTGPAVINAAARTVAIEVADGTNRNGLVAAFALSAGATAKVSGTSQVSGATANNFTSPVTYAVIAADGSSQNWKVTVTVAASNAKAITSFSLAEQTGAATIDPAAHTVAIEVANGTTVSSLVATFALSAGATAKVGTVGQVSGVTANDFTSPVIYEITAADGSTQNWTVTVTVAASNAKAIMSFSFAEQAVPAVIDPAAHTVAIEAANGTAVNSLVAAFTLSAGATAKVGTVGQVSGVTANDFTSPVIYEVTAADGSTQNWTVTVTVASSTAKAITSFSFVEQSGAATIDPAAHTVAIEVANGTAVNSLVAAFTLSSGATAKVGTVGQVSGVTTNDFTSPFIYEVTAADGSTQNWTVTVTVAASNAKAITSFSLAEQAGPAVIDPAAHTVAIEVANGTAVNSLVAAFTLSAGATAKVGHVGQVSGVTTNDFTSPVIYEVTAADGSTQNWTVTVTVSVSNAKAITSFSFVEQSGVATIDPASHSVAIEVANGTTVSSLVATFALSAGATAKVGHVGQVSGVTANDFTSPVIYEVTAADGSTQNWTVTVTVAASNAKAITSFSFAEQAGPPVIDPAAHTVAIEVANGTAVNSMVATFALSAGATAKVGTVGQVSGVTTNDFTSPVIYEVTAVDGSTQNWTVTVTVKPALSSAATLTSTIGTASTGGTASETLTNIPYGITLAALKAAITPAANASFEVYDADGITVASTLETGAKVIVTAQDGTTKVTYTVTVNGLPSGGGGWVMPTSPNSTKISSTDGKLTLPAGKEGEVSLDNEVVVSIPANASDKEIIITIDKMTDSKNLLTNNEVLVTAVYEILKNFPENFLNPVTLTFTFDPASLKSNQTVAVFYYDEIKKSWVEVTGGRINGNKISVTVSHFTKYTVFAVSKSVDVPGQEPPANPKNISDIVGHWAESAIKQAVDLGIVTGYPDGSFKPNHTVTRAEFTVMLMNTLKLQETEPALTFTDTAKIGAWARSAVAQAVQAGYVKGYQDGTFRPDAAITRAEMAMMVTKASGLTTQENTSTGFADDKDIPAWAKGAVAAMKQLGLITGKGGNAFAPAANTTRAEAVAVLLNMLAYKDK